jgi:D-threo-aldose 1-dehydrogenase
VELWQEAKAAGLIADEVPVPEPSESKLSLPALQVSNRTPQKEHLMFGASGLGCLYQDVSTEQSNACLDAVLAHDIRYIDTAPWYGAGLSESRLGDYLSLRELPAGFKISTKCGRVIKAVSDVSMEDPRVEKGYFDGFKTEKYHSNVPVSDYSRAGILESFRQSCERLKLDRLHSLRSTTARTSLGSRRPPSREE